MKILFLGLMFCEKSLQKAYTDSKCGVQMAPHLFQKRLTDGFSACEDVEIKIINIPPIGSFPINYRKLFIKGKLWEGNEQIGFLNLPAVKQTYQRYALQKAVRRWLDSQPGSQTYYIIAYSIYEPFLDVICNIKKDYKDIHICVIQTDAVPGRGGMRNSKKIKKRGDRLVEKAKKVDSFVLLSEPLAEPLEVRDRPFVITECICDSSQAASKRKSQSENIFLYSGTTERIYGICEIVDAFKLLPDAQLWICGAGNGDEYILEAAKTHWNIQHFGYVNQEQLQQLRDRCDFLINPRRPTGTYTKYSFPSKTAEYMMSEKPAVMYRLEGIPQEYNQYLNYLTAENAIEIAEQLRALINTDYEELAEKARKARVFMMDNKCAENQAKRITKLFQ